MDKVASLQKAGIRSLKKTYSKIDNTVKFIFTSRDQIIELSFIDKNDGKDIICVPSQTSCKLGCKFCFLTDYDIKVRNLSPEEIVLPIQYMIDNLKLLKRKNRNQVLLISVMGCGEPLLNLDNVIAMCEKITEKYKSHYKIVRFAVASLIPKISLMEKFIEAVKSRNLRVKFHLSLHSPREKVRQTIMPSASSVLGSIEQVKKFMRFTANSAEIHYSLISDINDRDEDMLMLIELFENTGIPIKFLIYNEKPSIEFVASLRVEYFREVLESHGIKTEFYIPPGRDIGSSCGQFLMDYYEQFNEAQK